MVTSARVVGGQLTFLLLTSTITHGAVLYGRTLCCLDESPHGGSRSESGEGAAEASLKDVRCVESERRAPMQRRVIKCWADASPPQSDFKPPDGIFV